MHKKLALEATGKRREKKFTISYLLIQNYEPKISTQCKQNFTMVFFRRIYWDMCTLISISGLWDSDILQGNDSLNLLDNLNVFQLGSD